MISSVVFILLFICGCASNNPNAELYQKIDKYKELLKKEANNCFYLGQIASSYQALYDFDNAIAFYKKSIDLCPNDAINIFQLGLCHYLIMDKDQGVTYMENAIEIAKQSGNNKLFESLKNEKKAWLDKWPSIKEQKWNKE